MTVTADSKRRVVLPPEINPGDVFDVEKSTEQTYVLTRLEKPGPRVRLVREGKLLVATSDREITFEDTRRLLGQFP